MNRHTAGVGGELVGLAGSTGRRPGRQLTLSRQRAMMLAERSRADHLGDLRADRVVMEPVLGHGTLALTLDE